MKVKDIMTKDVKFCTSDSSLADAAMIMWEYDCGVVPVVDQDQRIISMLTDRDICMAVVTKNRLASEIKASELVIEKLYCCDIEESMEKALETMQQQQVRRLPVIEKDNSLQGIISLSDIVQKAQKNGGAKGLTYEKAMQTLKAVCEPHQFAT